MIASPQKDFLTPQEYFAWEETQGQKYEYIDGEIFVMTGGTVPHGTISLNFASILKNHLRGSSCRAFALDVKLGVSEDGPFYYPDIMVTCNERDRSAIKVIYHPCLIAEVLSPSTEAYDRGRKFANYRRIQTLQEYLLINAEGINVECFRPNDRGKWELTTYSVGEEIRLTSIDVSFPIELLYEDIWFST